MKIETPTRTYRTIDPARDADLAFANQRDACIATFGDDSRCQSPERYLRWLTAKVDEFPEGFLLGFLDDRCVGQLELEVPYGLSDGYVNLFYVMPEFRRRGFGRLLHERAEIYFAQWDATRIQLHVSPRNSAAVQFYRRMGYRRTFARTDGLMWAMEKMLPR